MYRRDTPKTGASTVTSTMRVIDQSTSFDQLNMPQDQIVGMMTMTTVTATVTINTIDRYRGRLATIELTIAPRPTDMGANGH